MQKPVKGRLGPFAPPMGMSAASVAPPGIRRFPSAAQDQIIPAQLVIKELSELLRHLPRHATSHKRQSKGQAKGPIAGQVDRFSVQATLTLKRPHIAFISVN